MSRTLRSGTDLFPSEIDLRDLQVVLDLPHRSLGELLALMEDGDLVRDLGGVLRRDPEDERREGPPVSTEPDGHVLEDGEVLVHGRHLELARDADSVDSVAGPPGDVLAAK